MPLAVSGVRGRQPATPVWPSSYGDTTDSQPRPWTVPVASRQLPAGFDGLTCRRRRYTSINFSTLSSLMRGRKSTSSTIIQRCRSRLQSAYKVNDCSCIAPSIPRRNLRKGARFRVGPLSGDGDGVRRERQPSGDEADPAERRNAAEPGEPGRGEDIEASREQDRADAEQD